MRSGRALRPVSLAPKEKQASLPTRLAPEFERALASTRFALDAPPGGTNLTSFFYLPPSLS